MAKADFFEEPPQPIAFGDLHILTIPSETFKALTHSANSRGLTLAQLVQKAFDGVLQTTEQGPRGPRLLTEQEPKPGAKIRG